MPSVHDVLTTANGHVHDVLNTLVVHDVLTIDTYLRRRLITLLGQDSGEEGDQLCHRLEVAGLPGEHMLDTTREGRRFCSRADSELHDKGPLGRQWGSLFVSHSDTRPSPVFPHTHCLFSSLMGEHISVSESGLAGQRESFVQFACKFRVICVKAAGVGGAR